MHLALLLTACGTPDDSGTTPTATSTTATTTSTTTSTTTVTGTSTTTTTTTTTPWGLDSRPPNPTCVAWDRPLDPDATVALERVYDSVSERGGIFLMQAPGDGSRWFLGDQDGRVWVFDDDPSATRTEWIDIADRLETGSEAGLLGMAFHPDYAKNGEVYLSYTGENTSSDRGPFESRVSRFLTTDGGLTLDPDTEDVVFRVTQPYTNHNGGRIAFGPDGYLYLGLGDGGSAGDPDDNGQDPSTVLGAMLRIDVDDPGSKERPYGIPADNPFATSGGAPEVYAWGLRNPWGWSFDRDSGTLWAGDVGQGAWEEVSIVELGGNYGWNHKEGSECYAVDPCDDPTYIDPVAEYSHAEGLSITGGFVYRGEAIPGLSGQFLYGDYISGNLWSVGFDDATGKPEVTLLLASTGRAITAFGQDQQGELYVVDFAGSIWKVVPVGKAPEVDPFPRLLSETGCVDPLDPTAKVPALIPYIVNAPFWSDGGTKARWLALPDGATIDVGGDWDLDLPVGSVVVKEFAWDGRRVETRLMLRHADGEWAGYSYAWNEDGTDAELVDDAWTADVGDMLWYIPSRSECLACHTTAAGRTLGLELGQINGVYKYDGGTSNQIATWDHIGLFSQSPGDPSGLPVLLNPYDGFVDVDLRARTWLDVNCSMCHQPGSTSGTDLDLRIETSLADLGGCDVAPVKGDLGLTDARIIAPGAPERSVLVERLRRVDVHRMPPISSDVVDQDALVFVSDWVAGLKRCE